jgi:WD40 repeat protein
MISTAQEGQRDKSLWNEKLNRYIALFKGNDLKSRFSDGCAWAGWVGACTIVLPPKTRIVRRRLNSKVETKDEFRIAECAHKTPSSFPTNPQRKDPFEQDLPELIEDLIEDGAIATCAFNRQGSLLAAGCTDGRVNIYDWMTRGLIRTLVGHGGLVTSLRYILVRCLTEVGRVMVGTCCRRPWTGAVSCGTC